MFALCAILCRTCGLLRKFCPRDLLVGRPSSETVNLFAPDRQLVCSKNTAQMSYAHFFAGKAEELSLGRLAEPLTAGEGEACLDKAGGMAAAFSEDFRSVTASSLHVSAQSRELYPIHERHRERQAKCSVF